MRELTKNEEWNLSEAQRILFIMEGQYSDAIIKMYGENSEEFMCYSEILMRMRWAKIESEAGE